jgi:phospholipase C
MSWRSSSGRVGRLLLSAGLIEFGLAGCGGGSSSTSSPPPSGPTFATRFQHVVVIVQENRTPDNLFHGLPNADIANSGTNSKGETIELTPVPLSGTYDLGHTHKAFEQMYNNGKMDGANLVTYDCGTNTTSCPPPNPQFKYVDPDDVQPYFHMAESYTFGDRMFQTNQGPSFPAHQFIISGTSAPTASSDLFAAENPILPANAASTADEGCTAPAGTTVALIDPSGDESSTIYPCFEHDTLMDLLDAKLISWRYYSPTVVSIWDAPDAIGHLRFGPDWGKVIIPHTKILTDIANGDKPCDSAVRRYPC